MTPAVSISKKALCASIICDGLIDNKVEGGGGRAGETDLCRLSICQAFSPSCAREERVINRFGVISDVSVFLPRFQVIMFTGFRASREPSILLTCLGETVGGDSLGCRGDGE